MIDFQGRRAWQIDTPELVVTILECGGHIAEILYKPAHPTNPLWIQDRPTIDSDQFDPVIHGALYGTDSEAKLISGLQGHNLCFPFWGAPSPSEEAAGMTFHGETNIVRWQSLQSGQDSLQLEVTLPQSSMRFAREIRCAGQVIYFSETARNLSAWDHPVGWCEHVTFGPPFLTAGETGFASNMTSGFATYDAAHSEITWPHGTGDFPHMLSGFRSTEGSDLVNSFLVDPGKEYGYFVAWNPRLRLLIGYVFSRRQFPWFNVWEARNEQRHTRGMEFSNTPLDGTMKTYVGQPEIWGVPAFEWLHARSELRKDYAAFVSLIPENYCGVAEVTASEDTLTITETKTGDPITIAWRKPTWA